MKGSLLLLIFTLCVSTAFSDDCDFTITSSSQIDGILGAQTWAPAKKVLCFAAGTYSYSAAPDYQITAPQEWRGARVNDDPTCNQQVNPPCPRLQSAKSYDASVESVLEVTSATTNHFFTATTDLFNLTGFAINFVTTIYDFADVSVIYMYNNYMATTGSIAGSHVFAYNNYFDGTSGIGAMIYTTVAGEAKNNYFFKAAFGIQGVVGNIRNNTFIFNVYALKTTNTPIISNNLFLFNVVVADVPSGSVWEENSFILNDQVIQINTESYTLSITGNCFEDNTQLLSLGYLDTVGSDNSGNNYFGPSNLALAGFLDTGSGQLGSPEQTPPVFSSPLVCPKAFFSVFALHPKDVIIGQPMDIFWSFKIETSLISSGFSLSSINQSSISFYFYDEFNSAAPYKSLNLVDTIYINKFGVASNTLSYTPQLSDFHSTPIHGTSSNSTLVARVAYQSPNSLSNTFVAADVITVTSRIPSVCRNRSDVVEIPKTARFNGPVTLNLTQLFCDTVQWNISAINQQPLHAPAVSVNGDNSVTFTIDPNSSGLFNFVLNITSFSSPSLVHRLLAKVNIINTRPYVTPYRYFNFTELSNVQNVNLLFNSSDADSDTVTIKSIYPRGDKGFTNIDDLSVYFHFNGTGFVVVSDASGNLSIHDVDLTNPSIPATGGAFSGKFKFSFGINFVATDGDRSNSNAEGSVIFHHIPSSSS